MANQHSSFLAKSRRPISVMLLILRRGRRRTNAIAIETRRAKENCALRCLSSTCYELVYESDPLEEGEKDLVRGQEFKYCMHNVGGSHQGQSPVGEDRSLMGIEGYNGGMDF
ncbi:unnamed protein product [Prunus armeniaca]|uniref:Uncharacterized protein n=1 Tax=Prunus armeniaca TaxID=36596 RepID=A0A6J5WDH2_PRUAR|nr:unnamed protein product [Prunus armeniaca]